jgi:hypothetical protein
MKLQKMKKYSFLLFFLIGITCFGQNYKGVLEPTKKDGFHKIMLTSDMRAASKNNFHFIRIKDSSNQEVPYVLKYQSDRLFASFLPIPILSTTRIKDSVTAILIENKTLKNHTNLILQITNAAISKRYNLLGSDDSVLWFGITLNKILNLTNSTYTSSTETVINFPINAYKFLKIEISDKNSLPINVLGVGVYENNFFSEEPIAISNYNQEIIQIKDKKVTQIKFAATNYHEINSISFDVKSAFFLRNVKIIAKRTHKIKKRDEVYDEVISSFELSSKNENIFTLNNVYEKEFIVEIDNQDNPALEITAIKLFQQPIYLISNLKKNEKYQFEIDTTFLEPSYDLGNFVSDNILNIEEVLVIDFLKVKTKKISIQDKPFWQTPVFMWICIIFVGLFIVYFALDLLKDVKRQEKK